jgi:hypothetical protein
MNHRPKVEGTDTVEEHKHPMNHRPEVEGTDREDNGIGENMMVEVKVVEREREGVMLVRHWTSDGVTTSRCARREREELVKSGCSRGHTTFACSDFSCTTWCRV